MVKVKEEKDFFDVMSLYPTKMVPKNMEVTNKIGVTVWTMSKQQIDKKYFETETLLSATRIVNTFKPKRNHKVVKVEFEEVGVLV